MPALPHPGEKSHRKDTGSLCSSTNLFHERWRALPSLTPFNTLQPASRTSKSPFPPLSSYNFSRFPARSVLDLLLTDARDLPKRKNHMSLSQTPPQASQVNQLLSIKSTVNSAAQQNHGRPWLGCSVDRVLSWCTKVMSSTSGQGTYEKQ